MLEGCQAALNTEGSGCPATGHSTQRGNSSAELYWSGGNSLQPSLEHVEEGTDSSDACQWVRLNGAIISPQPAAPLIDWAPFGQPFLNLWYMCVIFYTKVRYYMRSMRVNFLVWLEIAAWQPYLICADQIEPYIWDKLMHELFSLKLTTKLVHVIVRG